MAKDPSDDSPSNAPSSTGASAPRPGLDRRGVLVGGFAGAAAIGGFAAASGAPATSEDAIGAPGTKAETMSPNENRMPVVYLPHGGGPWPFVDMGMDRNEIDPLADYLRNLATLPPTRPRAVLVISAHWEEPAFTVMTAQRPPMLYDYYGFPPASYEIQWPAPGAPELAHGVRERLEQAGFPSSVDATRGFDHGTFVPLKLTYPNADVPTIQLSLRRGLDPAEHVRLGRALAPLRDEGVLIVGSGMSYHNMRGFGSTAARAHADAFDAWLRDVVSSEPARREEALAHWTLAPSARSCHPREEHLLPLMVAAGAALDQPGEIAFSGTVFGVRVSAVHFG